MTQPRPLPRTWRPPHVNDGRTRGYLEDARFGTQDRYVSGFLLVQKDLLELFDYVEPHGQNDSTFSFRIHALLMRACMEVEANCKAILRAHGYVKLGGKQWNGEDYRKVNASHHLSSYRVHLPRWGGAGGVRAPFAAWSVADPLAWYQAYNAAKHDVHADEKRATFKDLVDACAALVTLLHAQFENSWDKVGLLALGPGDGTVDTVGEYFRLSTPADWADDEKYAFDWNDLKVQAEPFARFDYSLV